MRKAKEDQLLRARPPGVGGGGRSSHRGAPRAGARCRPRPVPSPTSRRTRPAAGMPTRNLGRTGVRAGIFSLGGQSALERGGNEAVAVPIVERALDLGVNYMDTSSIYGGPERWSERYIGQVMKRRRSEAFLASKTKERTRDGSLRMLEQSLKLLDTDHLDLWQLHDIGTLGTWTRCSRREGPWRPSSGPATRRWSASSASPATTARNP